jgi:acetyl-CoA synthetase
VENLIWHPTAEQVANSRISRFMRDVGVRDLAELQAKAAVDPAWFWAAAEKDLGIHWYEPYRQVLDTSQGIPWARWFVGGKMNLAADCVDKHVATHRDKVALLWEGEEGAIRRWTYGDLWAESNRLAHGLRSLGIGKGDRVGLYLPMIPETVAAIMAVAKVGAIFTPIFSGYAAPAVAARLQDSGARLLITADGFFRRGHPVAMKAAADEAAAASPTVEKVLVVRRLGAPDTPWNGDRDVWYHDLVAGQSDTFATEPMEAEDPVMIIYTSGTTGRPKGAVHVHCGFPIKGAQDMAHLFDVGEPDVMFWFTDIGWMMGPWAIFGSLMLGATCVLYDGAPDYPAVDRLWGLVANHGVTHLGVSPTLVRALMPHGDEPARRHDLSSLRMFGSTGEPWNPDPYRWLFTAVGGGRCPIINYSGGTEISGGIVGCVPIRPLKVASFNCVVPGMAADVVDDAGNPVRGEVGELVIRQPWVGMTRGFWRDPERYAEAYWSRFPGVWVHGDWASIDADGFWYIHGRSDDTIKVAGKRLGPAEVESALVGSGKVAEAAAIGVPHPVKGETVVGFVVLKPGVEASEELRVALADGVAAELGKALRPEAVKFVASLPKTRNAKIMRRVVKAVYLGKPLGDLTALENVDAVEAVAQAT